MGVEDFTPAMRQYLAVKEKNKDCIVLFRMGDFYEMFFEDAAVAARVLSITLTTRNKNKEGSIPLCGFPYHAAASYIAKLVDRGFKVAVCEQMEDPKLAKGVVKREVVRVITPGLIACADNLDIRENIFVAAVCLGLGKTRAGASFLDLSTGEFYLVKLSRNGSLESLFTGIDLREIIVPAGLQGNAMIKTMLETKAHCLINYFPDDCFALETAMSRLKAHFGEVEMGRLNLEDYPLCVSAAGALLSYVEDTQKTKLDHINKIKWYGVDDCLVLDETARQNLELFHTILDNRKEGSLLHLIDETVTSMGARKIRWWLTHPLTDPVKINERLSAVSELKYNHVLRGQIRKLLKNVYDLERLGSRIAMAVASARDIIALKNSLKVLPEIKGLAGRLNASLIDSSHESVDAMQDMAAFIDKAIVDSPPAAITEGGIIKEGYDPDLDILISLMRDGRGWIASLEEKERQRTGINSLKIGFNNVFGYYIEVTKAHATQVPDDYVRRQTLVNAERYTNAVLKEYEFTVLNAKERAKEKEYDLFTQIRTHLAGNIKRIQKTALGIAHLDVLAALAEVAEKYNYCLPHLNQEGVIDIKDSRHPVVERVSLADGFVPNDIKLDLANNRFLIITGPNMAGKSTFIRQVALIVLMAQMGSFVPAAAADIGLVDRIFTRIGAADSLAKGQSTFMVEMTEVANILKHATNRSLIILDEVGRGTSTFDGVAIAWAVAEYVYDTERVGSRTLFATHYHQLTELAITHEGVKNYNIAVKEGKGSIVFLRKIVPGGTNRSYGVHVARLAGLPEAVIIRAMEILDNLENGELDEVGMPKIARSQETIQGNQLTLFDEDEGLIADEIRDIDLFNITPLDALNKLSDWKKRLLT